MGLELVHVLSDERHHGPFECAICQNLCGLDALVTTPCSHVFCRLCLEKWLNRDNSSSYPPSFDPPQYQHKCPTCNHSLDFHSRGTQNQSSSKDTIMIGNYCIDCRKLEDAQPLAFRVLRRIQVACPLLAKHGCTWKGDYEDLTEHLLSDTAHRMKQSEYDTKSNSSRLNAQESLKSPPVKRSKSNEVLGENHTREKNSNLDSKEDSHAPLSNPNNDDLNQRHELAESFKIQANAKFSYANFIEARDLYTKAISVLKTDKEAPLSPELLSQKIRKLLASLFANRAATYLQLKEYLSCIHDCESCLKLDKNYIKAYVRMSKAQIEIGSFANAYKDLHKAFHTHNPTSSILQKQLSHAQYIHSQFELGKKQYLNSEYASASATFGSLLRLSKAKVVILSAARSDLKLGLVDQAMRLSLQVIRSDTQNAEGYEVRGLSMFFNGDDLESSCKLLRQALRFDPDNKEAKDMLKKCRKVHKHMIHARNAFFHRNFEEAISFFTKALEDSDPLPTKAPLYSILHAERGEAYIRQKNYTAALQDASNAIYSREDHVIAWLVKLKAFHGLDRHEEAKEESDDLMNKWGSGNDKIRKANENANFQVRRLKRPDFYKLFGVSSIASEMEIKKQYKVKALELHPDRLSGNQFTDDDRSRASEQFKLLGDGFEILCDDFKRKLYDEGYDQEAIRERVAMAERAAHRKPGGNFHGHHGGHSY